MYILRIGNEAAVGSVVVVRIIRSRRHDSHLCKAHRRYSPLSKGLDIISHRSDPYVTLWISKSKPITRVCSCKSIIPQNQARVAMKQRCLRSPDRSQSQVDDRTRQDKTGTQDSPSSDLPPVFVPVANDTG